MLYGLFRQSLAVCEGIGRFSTFPQWSVLKIMIYYCRIDTVFSMLNEQSVRCIFLESSLNIEV